jgi:hypothetical protein
MTAALILGAVQLASSGGLSQHLLAFSVAGIHGGFSVFRAPNQVLFNLLGHAFGTVVLLPVAIVGALLAANWRTLSVIHFALGYSLLALLVVYTDVGTGSNQLIDMAVLIALAVGHLAGRAAALEIRARDIAAMALAVVVLWATSLDLVRTVGFDLRGAIAARKAGQVPERAATRVAQMVAPSEEVFAEDPSIYTALGREPLLMDAFMLTRLDRTHPQWVDPLVARIAERRFSLVVLVVSLDDGQLEFWWEDFHLGPRIARALRKAYKFDRIVGRYYLYRPS